MKLSTITGLERYVAQRRIRYRAAAITFRF